MDRYTPKQAAIIVVDYRRGLLDVVTGEHLLGYAGSEPTLTASVGDVAKAHARPAARADGHLGPAAHPRLVDRARNCSSWSTTTSWWPRRRGNPLLPLLDRSCRRPATSACT